MRRAIRHRPVAAAFDASVVPPLSAIVIWIRQKP